MILGLDEVGYGAAAGPITVAGVILGDWRPSIQLKDSKQLSSKKREKIAAEIHKAEQEGKVHTFCLHIDVARIKNIGVSEARNEGFRTIISRAVHANYQTLIAEGSWVKAIVDGNTLPGIPNIEPGVLEVVAQIGADRTVPEVSAASIVAKVARDALMTAYHHQDARYFWGTNKGYLTKEHLTAMVEHGLTQYHRHYVSRADAAEILNRSYENQAKS